jgi:hypothetical protein
VVAHTVKLANLPYRGVFGRTIFRRVLLMMVLFVPATITTQVLPVAAGGLSPSLGAAALGANIDVNFSGAGSAAALANPAVGAVAIPLDWASIEPRSGQLRFATLDQTAAAWTAQGKNFILIVRFANESGGGAHGCSGTGFLPAWEVARIPTYCDSDMNMVIPDYFDPTFQSDFLAYVRAIAAHVGASSYRSHLLYVRIGLGLAGEGFPVMPCPAGVWCDSKTTDLSQLVAWGYSTHAWARWQEQMLLHYRALFAFTCTRVIYPMGDYGVDGVTHQLVDVEVAEWAANHGFGLGAQGLVPSPTYSSYAGIGTIVTYVRAHDPQTLIQFQTWSSLQQSATTLYDVTCVALGDIVNAEQLGAQSIEWYDTDATNPDLLALLAAWQQYVARYA